VATDDDWRLVGECDPVCLAACKHLEAAGQVVAQLVRQTRTQCVQRAALLAAVWAHAGEVSQ
jgi:hypothetical protein